MTCDFFSLNRNLVKSLPTVNSDEIDVTQEYPLNYSWNLLEMSAERQGKFLNYTTESMLQVATIKSISDFWRFWNSLPQPSELLEGKKLISQRDQSSVNSVMLFREGIKAAWEDPYNATGGELQFRLIKKNFSQSNLALADELWNNLVLGILGTTIRPASMITGIRLLDRLTSKQQHIRIEVWFTGLDKMAPEDCKGLDENASEEQKTAFYENCIKILQSSVENCMLTRLDGRVSMDNKIWGETTKSMR